MAINIGEGLERIERAITPYADFGLYEYNNWQDRTLTQLARDRGYIKFELDEMKERLDSLEKSNKETYVLNPFIIEVKSIVSNLQQVIDAYRTQKTVWKT